MSYILAASLGAQLREIIRNAAALAGLPAPAQKADELPCFVKPLMRGSVQESGFLARTEQIMFTPCSLCLSGSCIREAGFRVCIGAEPYEGFEALCAHLEETLGVHVLRSRDITLGWCESMAHARVFQAALENTAGFPAVMPVRALELYRYPAQLVRVFLHET